MKRGCRIRIDDSICCNNKSNYKKQEEVCIQNLIGATAFPTSPIDPGEDLLWKQDLAAAVPGSNGCQFATFLDYSRWSVNMIHGAHMFPGLIAGFSNYAKEKGTKLGEIKKLKFKKTTRFDLLYTIAESKDKNLEKIANIAGEFTDTNGNTHWYYGVEDMLGSPMKKRLENKLPDLLLFGEPATYPILNRLDESIKLNPDEINIPLHKRGGPFLELLKAYQTRLEKNNGFVRATILDMLNLACQIREEGSGVVMGYENLNINSDFNPAWLFDGSCNFVIRKKGKGRDVSGHGNNAYIFSDSFSINRGDEVLISGDSSMLKRA